MIENITCLIAATIILGILLLGYVTFSIIFYRRKTIQWLHVISQYREAFEDAPTMNIKDRVDASESLFSLIDTLIEYSIISDREYDILLKKKSKNLDVDKAIERIATSVFNWINPTIYTDVNSIVTAECIMTYIQKRTFVEYFLYLQRSSEGAE